ncbi:hypothetical protein JHK85_028293 [Glycine max]|nr:hypothetical protein JHK85_028293 [Glycine max]
MCSSFPSPSRIKLNELEKSKPVILTGDLNCAHEEIDIYNPAGNKRSAGLTDEERKSFATNFLSRGFVDTFRRQHPGVIGYTYWGYRHGGRKFNRVSLPSTLLLLHCCSSQQCSPSRDLCSSLAFFPTVFSLAGTSFGSPFWFPPFVFFIGFCEHFFRHRDEVLPREEASSARVLGDENGVSGRRWSSTSSCGRKVKGSSAGASGRTFLVSSAGARGRTPSSADSIFVLLHSRKNTFFRRVHFLLAEEVVKLLL